MGMAIRNNLDALHIQNLYSKNSIRLSDSMYKVSSGAKINSAGDDPSGMALSQRIETRRDSYKQAHSNIQNDSAIFKIADDALSNMIEVVGTIREKAVQASNKSLTDDDRTRLGNDIGTLLSRFDEIAADAKYGNVEFFNSASGYAKTNTEFFVQYGADAGDNWAVQFDHIRAASLGLTTADTVTKITTANPTQANLTGVITTVDNALTSLFQIQGKVGSYEQRLGYLADNATNQVTALTDLDSTIRDTNMAEGMTDFMKYNILTQASQLMLAQAGQNPAMVLKLLEP